MTPRDNTIPFKNTAGEGSVITKVKGAQTSKVNGDRGDFKKMAAKGAVSVGIQKCSY